MPIRVGAIMRDCNLPLNAKIVLTKAPQAFLADFGCATYWGGIRA